MSSLPYRCGICKVEPPFSSPSEHALYSHLISAHGACLSSECRNCNRAKGNHNVRKKFTVDCGAFSTATISAHVRLNAPVCRRCGISFYLRREYYEHERWHNSPGEERPPAITKRAFACKECDFWTGGLFAFWKHQRTHVRVIECRDCSATGFKTERALQRHLRTSHTFSSMVCPDCLFATPFLSSMESHMKEHRHDRSIKLEAGIVEPPTMSTCDTVVDLDPLESPDVVPEILRCTFCPYTNISAVGMSIHVSSHREAEQGSSSPNGQPRFRCPLVGCAYRTSDQNDLSPHLLRVHPAERLDAPEQHVYTLYRNTEIVLSLNINTIKMEEEEAVEDEFEVENPYEPEATARRAST
jgi:hypothetical protein